MRILVIGGTRFVGRHFVAAALERRHDVTIFHRGTGSEAFPEVDHRHGDRDVDLSPLAEGTWDATVDVSAYLPGQVRSLAAALGSRGGRHLFVSTVSVYAPPPGPGLTEDAELVELADPTAQVVTDQTYGGLKVLCERAAAELHGDDLLIVRPTYVVGPYDLTWRFPTWLARIAAGGEVLCPGPADAPMQVIDARDQAAFMVRLLETGVAGTFHTVSPQPPFSFGDLLGAVAKELAPPGTTLTWVDAEPLLAADLDPNALPLWSGGDPDVDVMSADPARAYAAGLAPRPLAKTIRDTWAWMNDPETIARPGMGLTPEHERALLGAAGQPALLIRAVPFDDPVAQELTRQVQAEYVSLYGGIDNTPMDPAEFAPPKGTFLVAWAGDAPVAMGGLRAAGDDDVELKRMFVPVEHRGKGYAKAVLSALEEAAGTLGYRRLILETGMMQPAAIALYEAAGYEPIPGFGYYRESPMNRCYAKRLSPPG